MQHIKYWYIVNSKKKKKKHAYQYGWNTFFI